MSKFKSNNHSNNYYFNFLSWGYYYFSAGALSYKKIVKKFSDESTTSVMT